jgi:PhnB protein
MQRSFQVKIHGFGPVHLNAGNLQGVWHLAIPFWNPRQRREADLTSLPALSKYMALSLFAKEKKMNHKVKAIPEGQHSLTPSFVVQDAVRAIDFYQRAFGAAELGRMAMPGSDKIIHAELKIGDSVFFLSDEFPEMGAVSPMTLGGTSSSLYLYVEDVDAAYQQAVEAGAIGKMPPTDMFWGDRMGKLVDPFGHEWGMATHREEVSAEEMEKRAIAFFSQACPPQES